METTTEYFKIKPQRSWAIISFERLSGPVRLSA